MEKMIANIQQLKESIFAVIGRDGATNFGIIKGRDNSAILIDADIRRMDEIDDALQRTGCRNVRFLVNTHENFDHSSANDYFEKQGATVIGSVGCQQALEEDGMVKFAEMAGRSPELKTQFPDLKMGLLQITFPKEIRLHLPGVDVHLLYSAHNGKSHSRGDTIVVLEQEQIVFAGDLLYTDFHPVTVYGEVPNWIQSLDNLLELNCLCVVPGHGPISHGGHAAYKDALLKFRRYLNDFYGRLMEMKSGNQSPEEIESYMKSGKYASLGKTWMVKRNIEYFLRRSSLN
jgi:cyclase